jgi:uncharacterized protein (DUF488 family)
VDDDASPDVVSVGYEGRTADELVELLVEAGVELLVDVRLTPRSRKPGLSSTRLAGALRERGIGYRHLPGLGNPEPLRAAFHRVDPSEGKARYLEHLGASGAEALAELHDLVTGQRVALLCLERDAAHCHRSCITDRLVAAEPSLVVAEL